jgi:hypothetical protein
MKLLTPKDFEQDFSWLYKYVRFADGKVLFCDACDIESSHKQIVNLYPGSKPVSAGQIKVRDHQWYAKANGSTTAKLPGLDDDDDFIAKVMGSDWLHNPELMYDF